MKTRKIIGGVSAAVAILSLSGAAVADHEADCAANLAGMIEQSARYLACGDKATNDTLGYAGTWPLNNPLWQRQAGKLKTEGERDLAGCEVHAKLATKLYAERPDYIDPDDGTVNPPPRNKKNSNDTRGAANALDPANLKFDTAVAALESFRDSVDASKPNTESTMFPALPDDSNDDPTQADWEQFLKDWANSTIEDVKVCRSHMGL